MTSHFKYKEKGFWINDALMQFALGYLYCWFKKGNVLNKNQPLYNGLLENSLGYYASYMHLKLESILTEEEFGIFKRELLQLVHNLNDDSNEFNIQANKNVFLKDFCNYPDYKGIEYYMPDKMTNWTLISIYLKVLFILQE